jgi:tetratricopeptide (TPR) repeat protein
VSACIVVLLSALAAQTPPGPSSPPEAAPSATTPAVSEAKRLFTEGRALYDLGHYAQAIEKFEAAYRRSQDPTLLFNIAQAHRLAGDCPRALENYQHFLRLDSVSPARAQADAHVQQLQTECGSKPNQIPAARSVPAAATSVETVNARPDLRRDPVLITALVIGTASAVTGAGAYRWNASRFQRWQAEDRRLASARPQIFADFDALSLRQRDNDSLAASIRRWDTLTVAATSLAVVAVVGAFTWLYLQY